MKRCAELQQGYILLNKLNSCKANGSQKIMNHYTSQEPYEEKKRKGVSVVDVRGTLQSLCIMENSRQRVWTEHPIQSNLGHVGGSRGKIILIRTPL